MSRVESESSDSDDSDYSDSSSDDARSIVKSDLEFLRSTKSVASKLQIFNQLVAQNPNPPSFTKSTTRTSIFKRQDPPGIVTPSSIARSFFQSQIIQHQQQLNNIKRTQVPQRFVFKFPQSDSQNNHNKINESSKEPVKESSLGNNSPNHEETSEIPQQAPPSTITDNVEEPPKPQVESKTPITEQEQPHTPSESPVKDTTSQKEDTNPPSPVDISLKKEDSNPSNKNLQPRRQFSRSTLPQEDEILVPIKRTFVRDNNSKRMSARRVFAKSDEERKKREFVKINEEDSEDEDSTENYKKSRRTFVKNNNNIEGGELKSNEETELIKREFRKETKRQFKKQNNIPEDGNQKEILTKRDFKREEQRKRTFLKKEEEMELKKREFKRTVLTGLVDVDVGAVTGMTVEELLFEKQLLEARDREFETQKVMFFSYVEQEQQKLTQAKTVLEEVAFKLEEERNILSKDQAKLHYDREDLNLLRKKLESQKDIQEILEEERQNYETEITAKNNEIQQIKEKIIKKKKKYEELKIENGKIKEEFEREKQVLLLSQENKSSEDIDNERLKLANEIATFEKDKQEFEAAKENPAVQVDTTQISELKDQLTKACETIELEKKASREIKVKLRKAKKDNIKQIEQNKILLSAIASKDRRFMNIKKQIKKNIRKIHSSYDQLFIREREELSKEKTSFEESKLKVEEDPKISLDDPCWSNVTWLDKERERLQKERLKVAVIKRYTEEERQRVAAARKKYEEDQTAFYSEKRSLFSIPSIVINIDSDNPETPKDLYIKSPSRTKSTSTLKNNTKRTKTVHIPRKNTVSSSTRKKKPSPSDLSPSMIKSKKKSSKKIINAKDISVSQPVENENDKISNVKTTPFSATHPGITVNRPSRGSVWGIRPRLDTGDTKDPNWSARKPRTVSMAATHREEDKPKRNMEFSDEKSETTSEGSPGSRKGIRKVDSGDISGAGDDEAIDVNDPFRIASVNPLTIPNSDISRRIENAESFLKTIVYTSDREISSAHLLALLLQLCGSEINDEYTMTFLLTYDYFMNAISLLKAIIVLYRSPVVPLTIPGGRRSDDSVCKSRIVDTLNIWISLRIESLLINKEWSSLFESFLNSLKTENPEFVEVLQQSWKNMEKHVEAHREKITEFSIRTPSTLNKNIDLISVSHQQLAKQLCLVEQMHFHNVNLEEFYAKAWDYGEQKAPNLSSLLERFGEMCYWVSTEIVTAPKPELRALLISKFLYTMNELLFMNNFNSLMQLYTGLNLPVVTCLKYTWSLVPKEDLEIMDKVANLMDPQRNYYNYRLALDPISEQPCIPFISLILRDLTLTEDEPNYINGDHINFNKLRLLSKVFAQLQDWQSQFYDYEEVPEVQVYFYNKVVKPQQELEQIVSDLMAQVEMPQVFAKTEQLGDDLLGELDKFDAGPALETIRDVLLSPDLFHQLYSWLCSANVMDYVNCLECWRTMYDFKYVNLSKSHDEAAVRAELAKDIINSFLQQDSQKYIGDFNDEILEELYEKLNSDNVQSDFFDEIIEGCEVRIEEAWREFCDSGIAN